MQDEPTNSIVFRAEIDVIAALDEMVKAEDTDRSKFIRRLIREEKARRSDPELQQYLSKFHRTPDKSIHGTDWQKIDNDFRRAQRGKQ